MTRPSTTWLADVLAKIDGLASLEKNWDSYGGLPIDPRSIVHAKSTITWLAGMGFDVSPVVTPLTTGLVQLEWPGREIEVEFRTDGVMEFIVTIVSSLRGTLLRHLKP